VRGGVRTNAILVGVVVAATLAIFIPYVAVKLVVLTALAVGVLLVALVC